MRDTRPKGITNIIPWKDIVYYDETSPTFLRWNIVIMGGKYRNIQMTTIGDIAGSTAAKYSTISYGDSIYKAHRVVWILFNGPIPEGMYIDHIDGNTQNNAICNLRLVTNKMNQHNMKMSPQNTSGVTGVSFCNNKSWVASWFDVNGVRHRKTFSIYKYGFDNAFVLACECREKMILEMNSFVNPFLL